jgi:hypothetical protein
MQKGEALFISSITASFPFLNVHSALTAIWTWCLDKGRSRKRGTKEVAEARLKKEEFLMQVCFAQPASLVLLSLWKNQSALVDRD